jgi:hypothetical protein
VAGPTKLFRPWRSRLFGDQVLGLLCPSQLVFVAVLLFLRKGVVGWTIIAICSLLAICAVSWTCSLHEHTLFGSVLGLRVLQLNLEGARAGIQSETYARGRKVPVIMIDDCAVVRSWLPGGKLRFRGIKRLGVGPKVTVVLGYSRMMERRDLERWVAHISQACGETDGAKRPMVKHRPQDRRLLSPPRRRQRN